MTVVTLQKFVSVLLVSTDQLVSSETFALVPIIVTTMANVFVREIRLGANVSVDFMATIARLMNLGVVFILQMKPE